MQTTREPKNFHLYIDGTGRVQVSAHSGLIYDLDWNSDSSSIATCSADKTATVWDLTAGSHDIKLVQKCVLPAPCYLYRNDITKIKKN